MAGRKHQASISKKNNHWEYIKNSIKWGKDLSGYTPKIGKETTIYDGLSLVILSNLTNDNN